VKLYEVAKQSSPRAKLRQWLELRHIRNYTIRPGGIVDVDGDVNLSHLEDTIFPCQFGEVNGHFICNNTPLTSLKGLPQFIDGEFQCWRTEIVSLSGVDKIMKEINGRFVCNNEVTHTLGLLLIKGITNIDINPGVDAILNKYLGTGDILSAQDELIDAGFIDQARL
jgi:hypothetical protein